jgi:hypothetical protein
LKSFIFVSQCASPETGIDLDSGIGRANSAVNPILNESMGEYMMIGMSIRPFLMALPEEKVCWEWPHAPGGVMGGAVEAPPSCEAGDIPHLSFCNGFCRSPSHFF